MRYIILTYVLWYYYSVVVNTVLSKCYTSDSTMLFSYIAQCSMLPDPGEGSNGPVLVPGRSSLIGCHKFVSVNMHSRNVGVLFTGTFGLLGVGIFLLICILGRYGYHLLL